MNATLDTGVLPSWSSYGAVAGSALLATALLLAAGAFSVALLLILTVFVAAIVTYTWSRRVEGPRRAKDRLVTLLIVAAFGLALIPLLSLVFEVA
jgi:phosphate transport system permease protein